MSAEIIRLGDYPSDLEIAREAAFRISGFVGPLRSEGKKKFEELGVSPGRVGAHVVTAAEVVMQDNGKFTGWDAALMVERGNA